MDFILLNRILRVYFKRIFMYKYDGDDCVIVLRVVLF